MTELATLPNELLSYEMLRQSFSQEDVAAKLREIPAEKWELHGKEPWEFVKDASAKTVRRWEQGIVKSLSPYYLRRLVKLFERPAQELGYPEKGIPFWHVPHNQPSQSNFFMNRDNYILKLHSVIELRNQQYKSDKNTDRTILQPQALVGLGGIGKTQIALEYVYRHAHEYQTIIWLRAGSLEDLAADFANIPTIVNLPQKGLSDQALRIKAVKEWLMHFTRWLLVFDDAEDVEVIRDFLPQKCFGHIIVTTRSAATGKLAQAIEVEKIPLGEAASFLLRRSKAIGLETQGTEVVEEKYAQAREIAKLADGLPLMLEQAGAYIETTGCGLVGYLADYEIQGALLRQKPQLPEKEYPHTVATAWQMSFDKVRQVSPVAAELLSLFAFLAPDTIPEEMITEAALKLGPVLSVLADNTPALNDTMAVLRRYSLVKRHEVMKTCSIHSLVQEVMRDGMREEEHRMWEERVVIAVDHVFPNIDDETYGTTFLEETALQCCQRYLPHALVCLQLIKQQPIRQWNTLFVERAFFLLRKVSIYLKVQAQYALAELFLQQLVAILEAFIANTPQERLGLANLAFADALIEMASTCWSQGKYNEAEKLYQHGLAILTSMEVPQDEKDTFNHLHIKCLWHLGSIYTVRGWHTKAESLLEQAVDFIQNVIDAKSDDYPTLLLNLAGIYVDQGKFKEAQTLYKKLIRKAKRTYGSNSYLVAMLSGRLARLYLDLDQRRNYTEAETLLQQALLFTTQDQPEHPHATSIYHDLGDLYLKQEKFVQAEEMYYQALSIDQKIFGNAHLVVASDLGQLATLNYEQNRFDEALSLRKEEMSILQKMWGEQHLDVAACFYLIGESHHLRALQILSLDKPDTISTDALGHFEEADKQYTKALEIAEVLGEKDTAELARDSLEALYQDRSNYFEES